MEREQTTTLYDCVVVANGDFPTKGSELLAKTKHIIACDGAVQHLHKNGFKPDAIIGDMDSIPTELRNLYADRLLAITEQDTNDLTKAAIYARESGYKSVLIIGATGKREDHTLGNISLLARYAAWFDNVEMISDYGRFTPLRKSAILTSTAGQQVSIFVPDNHTRITTKGLKWDVTDRVFSSWWQGTLNEASGEEFCIIFSEPEMPLIIYRTFM
jgi:thiamine pyrophosphokinase